WGPPLPGGPGPAPRGGVRGCHGHRGGAGDAGPVEVFRPVSSGLPTRVPRMTTFPRKPFHAAAPANNLARHRRHCRLQLDCLEERTVPSTLLWTNRGLASDNFE